LARSQNQWLGLVVELVGEASAELERRTASEDLSGTGGGVRMRVAEQ
jgi:hypothetical protein